MEFRVQIFSLVQKNSISAKTWDPNEVEIGASGSSQDTIKEMFDNKWLL